MFDKLENTTFHPCFLAEYWFRCLDLDGDGMLSQYELSHFYTEQAARLQQYGAAGDPGDFPDFYCRTLDIFRSSEGKIIYFINERGYLNI